MPKCWIHGETTEKPAKPLKTVPRHPDPDLKSALTILLAPKQEPLFKPTIYREYWELEEKLKAQFKVKWEENNKNLLRELQENKNKVLDLKRQIDEIHRIDDAEIKRLGLEIKKITKKHQELLNKIELLEL